MKLAIMAGNLEAFHAFLPYYPAGINEGDEEGCTILDYAAFYGHRAIVRELLELSAYETIVDFDYEVGFERDGRIRWTEDSYSTYLEISENM